MANDRILVTDGYWRKCLSVVRALGNSGLQVGVGERTSLAQALFSRYAKWRYVYPSVTRKPAEFIEWLSRIIEKNKYKVLITPEEETTLLVAKNIDKFKRLIKVPISSYEKITFIRDKFKLLSHANQIGIPCPLTKPIPFLESVKKDLSLFKYPLVLKPFIGTGARGVKYIKDLNDLDSTFEEIFRKYGSYLIQEYIPGDDFYGVSVLFNKKNKLRSAFVHKKIRQYPATGGASVYSISVYYPELVELSEKLLKSIGWYGIANIEFKIDKRDGKPKLMEVNPRFWGSLNLAVKSGINFPHLLYKLALTGDVAPTFDYIAGVKFRWLLPGDYLNFISNLKNNHNVDWKFFKFYEKNMHYAIFSLADPLPALGKSLSLIDYWTSQEMQEWRLQHKRQ